MSEFQKLKQKFSISSPLTLVFMAQLELISGVIAGLWGGWMLEGFFLIRPWGLVFGFILGCFAGLLNIQRLIQRESWDYD